MGQPVAVRPGVPASNEAIDAKTMEKKIKTRKNKNVIKLLLRNFLHAVLAVL